MFLYLGSYYTLEEEPSLGGSDCNAVRFGPMAYEDIEVLNLLSLSLATKIPEITLHPRL